MLIPTDQKELLTIWRVATLSANKQVRSKFLTKRDLAVIDLASICDYILGHALPLPVLAGLLLGMVKVAHHQSRFIYTDVVHLWVRIQRDMTTMHGMLDMPVAEASTRTITLKEQSVLDFCPEVDPSKDRFLTSSGGGSTAMDEHSFDAPSFSPRGDHGVGRNSDTPADPSGAMLTGEPPLDEINSNIIWSNDDFDFNDLNQPIDPEVPQRLSLPQQSPQRELATPEYSGILPDPMTDEHADDEGEYQIRPQRHRQRRRQPRGLRYMDPDTVTTVPARFYSHADELIGRTPASSTSSKKNVVRPFQKYHQLTPLVTVAGMVIPHPVFWKRNYRRERSNNTAPISGERQQVESARRGMSETSSSGPSGIMPYIADMVEPPWPHLPRTTSIFHRDSSASSGQWTDMDDPGFYDLDNMSDIGEGSFEMLHHDDRNDQGNDDVDEGVRYLRQMRLFASQDDGDDDVVDFHHLFTKPKTRSEIARGFYEVLSLASRNLLYPHQSEPYGPIRLSLSTPTSA